MTTNKTFIETVSNFNRELFHSKAITWLLNKYPEFQSALLESILGKTKFKEAIFVQAIAEIKQIDILVIYKIKNELNFIHIENKIKASESFKKKDKHTQNSNKKTLSQTEYYFTRLSSVSFINSLSDALLDSKSDKSKNYIDKINIDLGDIKRWKFTFLKPSHILKKKLPHLNSWREDVIESHKLKNPWITMSYENLVVDNLQYIKNPSASAKEYILFLTEKFTLGNQGLNTSTYLNHSNVQKAVKNSFKIIEISALQEWFLLLEHELSQDKRFQKVRPGFNLKNTDPLDFETNFVTDTGNNGGFLIQASFLIPNFPFPKAKTAKQKTARIGLQYEHNTNSAKMKFYFAAYDYNNVNISKSSNFRKDYNEKVEVFLSDKNFQNLKSSLCWDNKFNGSRGKSFCSRTVNIEKYGNYDELKKYFVKNLSNLTKDIQDLKDETWRRFIKNGNKM
ncbi:hypothetical protein [uncultured Polaribacter sp.]|uniref:hypothetical protein n=1 Tax=uncultured Polaribacter sp. TaxID=174711 RepID=UPI00261EB3D5|nr:hypothetical protein [uncultured Polaribacter sp.]